MWRSFQCQFRGSGGARLCCSAGAAHVTARDQPLKRRGSPGTEASVFFQLCHPPSSTPLGPASYSLHLLPNDRLSLAYISHSSYRLRATTIAPARATRTISCAIGAARVTSCQPPPPRSSSTAHHHPSKTTPMDIARPYTPMSHYSSSPEPATICPSSTLATSPAFTPPAPEPAAEAAKPPPKKRKSWGQQLPTPTTNLPPRYVAHLFHLHHAPPANNMTAVNEPRPPKRRNSAASSEFSATAPPPRNPAKSRRNNSRRSNRNETK